MSRADTALLQQRGRNRLDEALARMDRTIMRAQPPVPAPKPGEGERALAPKEEPGFLRKMLGYADDFADSAAHLLTNGYVEDVPLEEVIGDIATGIGELPRAAAVGVGKAVDEASSTAVELLGSSKEEVDQFFAGTPLGARIEIGAPKSVTGGVSSSIFQFVAGMIPVAKGLKAMGIGSRAATFGAAAIAEPLAFDEHEARLSSLIQAVPALRNPVTDYLEAEDDDTLAEGKLKQTIEGIGVGAVSDALFAGLRLFRRMKAAKAIEEDRVFAAEKGKPGGEPKPKSAVPDAAEEATAAKGRKATPPTAQAVPEQTASKPATPPTAQAVPEQTAPKPATPPTAQAVPEQTAPKPATPPTAQAVPEQTASKPAAEARRDAHIAEAAAAGGTDLPQPTPRDLQIVGDSRVAAFDPLDAQAAKAMRAAAADPFSSVLPVPVGNRVANINLANLNSGDEVRGLIAGMAEMLGDVKATARQGTEEALALANKLVEDPDRTIARLAQMGKEGRGFSRSEILAARTLLDQTGADIVGMARKIVAEGGNEAERFAFKRKIAFHNSVIRVVSDQAREAGRALQAFNTVVRANAACLT